MKTSFILFLLVFFLGCGVSRRLSNSESKSGKVHCIFTSDNEVTDFNGFISFSSDTTYFNVYGPIGINVAKMGFLNDSIFFVDLINKKIYKTFYSKVSESIENIFKGKFTKTEEQLLCNLFSFSIKISNYNCNAQNGDTGIKYKVLNRLRKRNIEISFVNSDNKYLLELKFVPVISSQILSLNLNKYNKFETISINLK